MKGIIFNVFLDLVEKENGYELVDTIIENSNLKSKGIYTSVGTYPHEELFYLINQLSLKTGISVPEILKKFGKYAFSIFTKTYTDLIAKYNNIYDFLERLEDTIHVEVLKLYPEAELPSFSIIKNDANEMILNYQSERKLADLAEGLLIGCLEYFKTTASLQTELVKKDKSNVTFIIRKQ